MGNFSGLGESVGYADDLLDDLPPKEAVLHKMKAKKAYYQKKFKKNFEEVAELLSNKEKLLKTYLNPDWYATKELNNHFVSEFQKSVKEEEEGELEEGDIVTPFTPISDEDLKNKMKFPEYDLDQKVKIKFVISELRHLKQDFVKRNLYFQVYAPVLSTINTLPEFGFYHLGLQIGPFMIEMVDSGICSPRKLSSRSAILSQDLSVYETEREIKNVLDKVADVIVKWNTKFTYVSTNGDVSKNTGNCQQFCFDILENLDIELPLDHNYPLKTYIQKLVVNDAAGLDLYMDEVFYDQFYKSYDNTKKKEEEEEESTTTEPKKKKKKKKRLKPWKMSRSERMITFKSHKELDLFVRHCQKLDVQFNLNYPQYWNILKGFDRSVWLKYFTSPKEENFIPLMKKVENDDDDDDDDESDDEEEGEKKNEDEFEFDCPFGDPTKSQSFIFLKE